MVVDEWAYLPNPHPNCTFDGTLDITDVFVNSDNALEIVQAYNVSESYTCTLSNTTGTLNNDAYATKKVNVEMDVQSSGTTVAIVA